MGLFEDKKKEVQAFIEDVGMPPNVLEDMPRRSNFASAAAQRILEADPDPQKRWSVPMARWLSRGEMIEVGEHLADIDDFMRLRRNAKRVPRGSREYANAIKLRAVDIGGIASPAMLSILLRAYGGVIPAKGACALPVEHITPGGLIVYRADDEAAVKTDPAAKHARWCVLGSYWGGYGGPPYYPVERDGSWAGIIVPGYTTDPQQAFRNGANTGMMEVDELTDLAPFIQSIIPESVINGLVSAAICPTSRRRWSPQNAQQIFAIADGMPITKDEYVKTARKVIETGQVDEDAKDDIVRLIGMNMPLSNIRKPLALRFERLNSSLHSRNAEFLISKAARWLTAEYLGKVAISYLSGNDRVSSDTMKKALALIRREDYHIVSTMNDIDPHVKSQFYDQRGKSKQACGYAGSIAVDLTDEELLSGAFYYGAHSQGMIALHIKSGDDQFWRNGEPFTIAVPFDDRVAIAIELGNIRPVRTINPKARQIDDESLRSLITWVAR